MTFNKMLSDTKRRYARGYSAEPASEVKLDGPPPTIWDEKSLQK